MLYILSCNVRWEFCYYKSPHSWNLWNRNQEPVTKLTSQLFLCRSFVWNVFSPGDESDQIEWPLWTILYQKRTRCRSHSFILLNNRQMTRTERKPSPLLRSCTKGICGGVSTESLNWLTWSTFCSTFRSTSQSTHNRSIRISWHAINILIVTWSTVGW